MEVIGSHLGIIGGMMVLKPLGSELEESLGPELDSFSAPVSRQTGRRRVFSHKLFNLGFQQPEHINPVQACDCFEGDANKGAKGDTRNLEGVRIIPAFLNCQR